MLWLLTTIVLLAGAMVFAAEEAGGDAYQIAREYDLSHLWATRSRMVALALAAVVAALPLVSRWAVLFALGYFAMMVCAFGFWFDVTLNRRRGLSWYYVGIDPNTAGTDQLITRHRIPGKAYQLGKAGGALVLALVLLWLRHYLTA